MKAIGGRTNRQQVLQRGQQGRAHAAAGLTWIAVAMITTGLTIVPSMTVLERGRIDALLREQQPAASGLVDPATLAGPARLLGAGTVVAGAVDRIRSELRAAGGPSSGG